MPRQFKYIIVGGGLAGASAVEGIRARDGSGSIVLFGKESRLPYHRPPLSKGLWLGKAQLSELPVHDDEFYKSHSVHLLLTTEIAEINPKQKHVADKTGARYNYDKLLIATGGAPRTLSFGERAVQYFRTADDYLSVRETAERSDEVIFIGGGFIGAELAAALSINKKKVTMIFPEQYLLQKIFPADLAEFVTDYFRKKGVTVLSGDIPTNAERSGGKSTVTTKSGKKISGDLTIGAIGLNLHTEMMKRAGLAIENGVKVNSFLQTSDPNIYAAGDVAFFPSRSLDKSLRIEHWDNARAQGEHAGGNMAGAEKPYEYLPYFWSDLFDFGFEAVGELDSGMKTFADWKKQFREGVVYYLDAGRIKGVLLWNVWEKVDAARGLIDQRKTYRRDEELKRRL